MLNIFHFTKSNQNDWLKKKPEQKQYSAIEQQQRTGGNGQRAVGMEIWH